MNNQVGACFHVWLCVNYNTLILKELATVPIDCIIRRLTSFRDSRPGASHPELARLGLKVMRYFLQASAGLSSLCHRYRSIFK